MEIRAQSARPGGTAAVGQPRDSVAAAARRFGPAIAGYGLPFLLVFYLAMKGGGYDPIVRGEVGVAVWWVVLFGAAIGVLPAARLSAAGWTMLALLGAFALWTTLGISWSDSAERSASEAGRIAAYLGVFVLAVSTQRGETIRRTVIGVGAGIATVSVLALLSRLHPDWFPANAAGEVLPQGRRLNYPLDYWNGLAALIAIGIPIVLWIAASARHVVARALSVAALPAMALAAYYTLSRGGGIEIAVALIVLVALYPRRLQLLPIAAVAAIGSALAIAAADQRGALADGLTNAAASSQASEMLALALVTCAGVGLIGAAIALAERHELYRMPSIRRPTALAVAGLVAIVALVGALAFGAPGKIADGWDSFRDPGGPGDTAAAVRERRRQRSLPVLVVDGRRRRGRAAHRDRARHVRVLLGARGHPHGLRPRRPLALLRGPRRARGPRPAADRRAGARGPRLGSHGRAEGGDGGTPGAARRGDGGLRRVRIRRRDRLGLGDPRDPRLLPVAGGCDRRLERAGGAAGGTARRPRASGSPGSPSGP